MSIEIPVGPEQNQNSEQYPTSERIDVMAGTIACSAAEIEVIQVPWYEHIYHTVLDGIQQELDETRARKSALREQHPHLSNFRWLLLRRTSLLSDLDRHTIVEAGEWSGRLNPNQDIKITWYDWKIFGTELVHDLKNRFIKTKQ